MRNWLSGNVLRVLKGLTSARPGQAVLLALYEGYSMRDGLGIAVRLHSDGVRALRAAWSGDADGRGGIRSFADWAWHLTWELIAKA
jgi:hypothetical protein